MTRTFLLTLLFLMGGCASIPQKYEISPLAANNLWFLYNRLETEFAFCAYGTNDGNTVVIDRIDLPLISYADENMVYYRECKAPNFLGMGHSHLPGTACTLSDTDIKTLLGTQSSFSFLVCDDNELASFSRKEVQQAVTKQSTQR